MDARRARSLTAKVLAVGVAAGAVALCPSAPAGADPACPAGRTLTIVAHEDDDLLFTSPDLLAAIQAGRCVRTIFVTAGDAGAASWYWSGREDGARAAYAQMIGTAG